MSESRNETYGRLAKVAGKVGVQEGDVLGLLRIPDKPAEDGSLNVGNSVTNDVKLLVKVRGSFRSRNTKVADWAL